MNVAKVVVPNIAKHTETHICGYGLGAIFAVHFALVLHSQGYLIKRVITFGQPKVIGAKDFTSCNFIGLIRILLPKDPVTCLFDNCAYSGQQLTLTSKPLLESSLSFGDQVSVPVKIPKKVMKKNFHLDYSLANYIKALTALKQK
eukprot:TRINITY_DN11636_c0_g5_i2.p1 TRINITY_DN11636_c0_g5~~TRINITY_DN11636_c0_g5_i2.p1  ORF type:complete len:145 (+),score=30.42 TRINITY_DN11636_c0_g5_i2:248-682(+)